MNRRLHCIWGLSVVMMLACHDEKRNDGTTVGIERGPIVNGVLENGYPAVGALTAWFGASYGGSFCTATLIRPNWLLTAAHCLEEATASSTRFYIGSNANDPNSGLFYRALEFKVHEGYNDHTLENDIALVRLQSSVSEISPVPYSVANLYPYEGSEVKYVGFGATEGINESGAGVKRSTDVPITRVYSTVFDANYNGHGTCFGDSGGPAFLTINGTESVVGVTSAGAVCNTPGCDPCQTSTASTRVDAYATWIAGKLDEPPPNCNDNSSICACAAACQANGSCNDGVCQVADCAETYTCLANCSNSACQEQCLNSATDEAGAQLNALFDCLDRNCDPNSSDEEYSECASTRCGNETTACFGEPVTGSATCDEVYDCFGSCQTDECIQTCFETGTSQAQQQVNAMFICFDNSCGNIEDEDAWVQCVQTNCESELTACFGEPESCQLTGGTCPAGMACFPTTTDGFYGCFETAGKPIDSACNPEASLLECVDGAACIGLEAGGGICAAFCTAANQCGAATCDFDITGVPGVGLCVAEGPECPDADGDGSCADVDCNDQNPAVNPGAAEQCDNLIDDNCNGQTDENCGGPACTDNDGDGFCNDVDCNDGDPTINPSGVERCGDGTDNNCNGQTDEGCDGCVDADGDGFCAGTQDCNDGSASISPIVVESCGNGIDDNCNGQIDEDCGGGATGGSSSGGCSGGESLPWVAALVGLVFVAVRRRRTV